MSTPKITTDERRRRLAVRHGLSVPVTTPVDAVQSVLALHSSDPGTVYLSVWGRAPHLNPAETASALYDTRELVRIYGMRRTLWVVERETHPLVEWSSTRKIAASSRKQFEKVLQQREVAEDAGLWLGAVLDRTLELIEEQGPILARELTKQLPELSTKLDFHNKQGRLIGTVGVSTRALVQLALESRIIRADPTGSWNSSQYRWASMGQWLGEELAAIEPVEAKALLVKSWLDRFGPATETDIKWWTGWTVTDVRKALSAIGAVEVQLDRGPGWVNTADMETTTEPEPWVALLPSLDPTTMGWKERDWYLGDYSDRLFDRNGNAGPTVWVDGRVVGGWAQRPDGSIVYGLLEDVGSQCETAIERKAADLEAWMGDVRITPRFRSPHDKELSG